MKILLFFLLLSVSGLAQERTAMNVPSMYAAGFRTTSTQLKPGMTFTVNDTSFGGGRMMVASSAGRQVDSVTVFPTINPAFVLVRLGVTDHIDVKWSGAKGDSGITDNYRYLQRADSVAEKRNLPLIWGPGKFMTTLPIFMRKNAHWIGSGKDVSKLYNSRIVSTTVGDTYCYFMGNFDVLTYYQTLHYSVLDTLRAGASFVKVTSAQTDSFKVGDIIQLESLTGYNRVSVNGVAYLRPYYAVINKVDSIDRPNGRVYLQNTLDTTFFPAKIGNTTKFISNATLTDKLGKAYYIADNCSVEKMSFESYDYVTKRQGNYRCEISQCGLRSTKGVGGNGLCYYRFHDNVVEYSYKAIEFAFFSGYSEIKNNIFTWFNGASDTSTLRPVIKMGENVRNCEISKNTFNCGDSSNNGPFISFDHAFFNLIEGNKIHAEKVYQNIFDVRELDDTVRVEGNVVRNNEVWAGSNAPTYINLSRGGTNASIKDNLFEGNIFHGKPASTAMLIGGVNNRIIGGKIETGTVVLDSDADKYFIDVPTAGKRLNYTSDQRTLIADADYTLQSTDRVVGLTSITASRTLQLPLANKVSPNELITIVDLSGNLSSSQYIQVGHLSSNTVNGLGGVKITNPYGLFVFRSDGVNGWTYDGSITRKIVFATPTITAGTGAGTSPTITVSNTDNGFEVNVIAGTAPATSNATVFTVSYPSAFGSVPVVVFSAASGNASNLSNQHFITNRTTTGFDFKNRATALTATASYTWDFILTNTQ